jgi:hypothetical protein
MSFTPKRKDKKPTIKVVNHRMFRDLNIRGLPSGRPVILNRAQGYADLRPTRMTDTLMIQSSNPRLLFDEQAQQSEQDGKRALPELYRNLMEQKAERDAVPLQQKIDKERARELIKRQNKDEIEQYKKSEHYLENQRRLSDIVEQRAELNRALPEFYEEDEGYDNYEHDFDEDIKQLHKEITQAEGNLILTKDRIREAHKDGDDKTLLVQEKRRLEATIKALKERITQSVEAKREEDILRRQQEIKEDAETDEENEDAETDEENEDEADETAKMNPYDLISLFGNSRKKWIQAFDKKGKFGTIKKMKLLMSDVIEIPPRIKRDDLVELIMEYMKNEKADRKRQGILDRWQRDMDESTEARIQNLGKVKEEEPLVDILSGNGRHRIHHRLPVVYSSHNGMGFKLGQFS